MHIGIIIMNGLLVKTTSLDTYVSKLKLQGIYCIQVPEDTEVVYWIMFILMQFY